MSSKIMATIMVCGSQVIVTPINTNPLVTLNTCCYSKTINYVSNADSKLIKISKQDFSNIAYMNKNTLEGVYYSIGDKLQTIELKKIPYEAKFLKFRNRYLIPYTIEEGYYCAEDRVLGIGCYGESYEDLCEDIKENISANWEMYVDCDIDELSKDAIILRNNLIKYIEVEN